MEKRFYGRYMPSYKSDKKIDKIMNVVGLTTRWEEDENGNLWPDTLHEVGLLYARAAVCGVGALIGTLLLKKHKKKKHQVKY